MKLKLILEETLDDSDVVDDDLLIEKVYHTSTEAPDKTVLTFNRECMTWTSALDQIVRVMEIQWGYSFNLEKFAKDEK